MEVQGTVLEVAKKLEGHLGYEFPFAIVSSKSGVIFCSESLGSLKTIDQDVVDAIFHCLPSKKNKFTCLKVATTATGNEIFVVYLKGKQDRHFNEDACSVEKHHHDIKGPLRNIANFLQLIKMQLAEGSSDKVEEYINFTISSIRILNELNESLLFLNNNKSSAVSISDVIRDIKLLLKSQFEKRKCRINLDGEIPRVRGAYASVLRVFKNLIENSLFHTTVKNLVISIRLVAKNEKQVLISFEDNGKELESAKGFDGNHLGLSICRDLMQWLDGSIRISPDKPGYNYILTFNTYSIGGSYAAK
ncbi:MAG: HAMP domain-containing histidine kinase [Holosporales bacterium]|jgi:hypothetical protein|nr:HAMP domain-containing histidine kinase [Holosporales bacterium]